MQNLQKLLKNAEKISYKQGFLAGRIKGFDQGLKFSRGADAPAAIRDPRIEAFLQEGFVLGEGGKMQSAPLYALFTEWIKRNHPGTENPTITAFGRKMGLFLPKRKTHGRIFYIGISRKEEPTGDGL